MHLYLAISNIKCPHLKPCTGDSQASEMQAASAKTDPEFLNNNSSMKKCFDERMSGVCTCTSMQGDVIHVQIAEGAVHKSNKIPKKNEAVKVTEEEDVGVSNAGVKIFKKLCCKGKCACCKCFLTE